MHKILFKFLVVFVFVFLLDQAIKLAYVSGYGRYEGEFFSLILTYNFGVAFSMFSFLGENLKFIQLALLVAAFMYLLKEREILSSNTTAVGLIFGAGCSNILDRFVHGGVVDYVFWHKWFEFAVFNLADVMIDLGVVLILWHSFFAKKSKI
ncbi:lipoprotein signal peptidase [Campylobacter sp. RM9344]|uniref:Lipoprotein signal peptidase n=1 Tax=Campylobacter californiensis TaxID=1032243 RepID=A0AAW3ZU86_9BACT|nr:MULTISPECIES: signal peptidase II [unclassified Campylobacter]MBE2985366.1 lipoprotein signal peptidase [Campylobacter sp. RM6883]MBE2995178.1 lipoprotein signal peptidase [Campylobacter sp. RM6913]MBE3029099.1 lipoprotein signal peptidase [Campylobacter sp. RM9344]MBE3607456.1 lipoprotein signal peptidase [Campylobacter sp. RM9337]QCD50007.1 prolipoprotein signal peptidase II [Campylobacter sp. RM6914]